MTENATASSAADLPEFPAHPEPFATKWSMLENAPIGTKVPAVDQRRAMVAEMDMNDAVLAGIDAEVSQPQQGEYLPLQGLAAYLRSEARHVDREVDSKQPGETLRQWADEADRTARGAAQAVPIAQEPAPLSVTSAPVRIWLDLGFDPKTQDVNFLSLRGVTWSAGNESGYGVEYVRADKVDQAPSVQDALQGAADWFVESGWVVSAHELSVRLCIGYNQAKRLFDVAMSKKTTPPSA